VEERRAEMMRQSAAWRQHRRRGDSAAEMMRQSAAWRQHRRQCLSTGDQRREWGTLRDAGLGRDHYHSRVRWRCEHGVACTGADSVRRVITE